MKQTSRGDGAGHTHSPSSKLTPPHLYRAQSVARQLAGVGRWGSAGLQIVCRYCGLSVILFFIYSLLEPPSTAVPLFSLFFSLFFSKLWPCSAAAPHQRCELWVWVSSTLPPHLDRPRDFCWSLGTGRQAPLSRGHIRNLIYLELQANFSPPLGRVFFVFVIAVACYWGITRCASYFLPVCAAGICSFEITQL